MQIPPFLEKLLLSNEAVFKNATLGMSGQNMVFVPEGKSAVILEFSIEPFVNNISNVIAKILSEGSDVETKYKPQFIELIKRRSYQLQIINDTYSTYFSFQDEFNISGNHIGGSTDVTGFVNLEFKGKREELFIYTDRSLYFNFIYPFKTEELAGDIPGIKVYYKTPDDADGFIPKIQDLPQSPITFKDNLYVDFVQYYEIDSPSVDNYYPVKHQLKNTGAENPQMEYLRFFQTVRSTTIRQPVDDASSFEFSNLFQVPLLNVKYALINKRSSDYGIMKP